MRRLLADPRFRFLLVGQTLTMFGDVALSFVNDRGELGACGLYLLLSKVGPTGPEREVAGKRLHTGEGIVPPG